MDKAQHSGMKALSLQPEGTLGRAVDLVSQERVSDGSHMNPDLVGPSRLQLTLYMVVLSVQMADHPVMGHCPLSILYIDGHLFPVHRASADGLVNGAFFLRKVIVDDGLIFSCNTVVFQLKN